MSLKKDKVFLAEKYRSTVIYDLVRQEVELFSLENKLFTKEEIMEYYCGIPKDKIASKEYEKIYKNFKISEEVAKFKRLINTSKRNIERLDKYINNLNK